MFCPVCGNRIDPTQKFCDSCGSPIESTQTESVRPDEMLNNPYTGEMSPADSSMPMQDSFGSMPQQNMPPQDSFGGMPPQSIPPQDSFGSMPQQSIPPQDNFGGMPPQPRPVVYSGTMPITNGTVPTGPVGGVKRSGAKKGIIIAIIILLIAALCIVGFFVVKKIIAHQYIVNNPTKSVLGSYKLYVDEAEKDNPLYQVVKDADKKGSLKLNASGNVNIVTGETKSFSANADLGYDVKDCNYYFRLDAGELLSMMTSMGDAAEKQNAMVELKVDPEIVYFNFDIFGKNGKYYVDNRTFRQDITSSIFSPDKDNVLGLDKQTFESFVEMYEKTYRDVVNLSKDDSSESDLKATVEKLIASLEKNGKVKVESGKAELKSGSDTQSFNADIVTYSFDKASLKAFLTEAKDCAAAYYKKILGDERSKDAISQLNSSFDSFVKGYDASTPDALSISLVSYLEQDSHIALKTVLDIKNVVKDSDDSLHAELQLFKAPEVLIAADMTVKTKGNGTNTLSLKVKKTDDGTAIKYAINSEVSANGHSDSISGAFEYNRSTKEFKLSGNQNAAGSAFSYTGKADIDGNKLIISLPDAVKSEYMSVNLNIEYSGDAPAKAEIGDAKNILKLSKEDFQQIFGDLGNSLTGLGGNGTVVIDDQSSTSITDAASIDASLKTVYAGVVSGTITNEYLASAPAANASAAEKKAAADKVTIREALTYSALESLEENIYNFGATENGTIYSYYDSDHVDEITKFISPYTTLGDLYGKN